MHKPLSLLCALAVLASACSPTPSRQLGELELIFFLEDGIAVAGRDALYDLGPVGPGGKRTMRATARNTGSGPLTLAGFERVEGDAARALPGVDDANPIFTATLADTVVPAGQSRDFELTFSPSAATTAARTVLRLLATNAAPTRDAANLTLTGTRADCEAPGGIDFGVVVRGDSLTQSLTFTNSRPVETQLHVSDLVGEGFAFANGSSHGTFTLAAGAKREVSVAFAPTAARAYSGTLDLATERCGPMRVRLSGHGVDSVLTWTPATVDFGYAPSGRTAVRDVTFENLGLKPVQLSSLGVFEGSSPSDVFRASVSALTVPPATRDAAQALVPGKATVRLSFAPTGSGARTATIRATTDIANPSSVVVPLRGVGGGPVLRVAPSPLDFGQVAWFAGASPPSFATRQLTLQNEGIRPGPADPAGNLRLGTADGAGRFTQPYWEVTPMNANSSSGELCIGTFDELSGTCTGELRAGSYDPAVGIVAGASVAIPVRVTPASLGVKAWQVKVFSNDLDSPTIIVVQANAVALPPCNVRVTPQALDFGAVAAPAQRELSFRISNLGTQSGETCLVSNLELEPERGVFSLPGGAVASRVLAPGESWDVAVRVETTQAVQAPTTATANVRLNVASPVQPQVRVAVSAELGQNCVQVTPSTFDFGTVQRTCNSPVRTFFISNVCPTTPQVIITGAAISTGAPEFSLAPTTFPFVLGGVSSVPLQVKYQPVDDGPDFGTLVVRSTQGTRSVDTVIALRGRGDAQGLNTDVFPSITPAKADVLLVVGATPTMVGKQAALAANVSAFTSWASSMSVDWRVGVITADPAAGGRLLTTPAGTRMVNSVTPNLAREFGDLVNVGIGGSSTRSCMEPAVAALTTTLVNDPMANQGLLRRDAALGVVCVTDSIDQVGSPASRYLFQLQEVKGAQRPGLFSYSVIGPFLPAPPAGCAYDGIPDDGKHAYMIDQTRGAKEEICTSDWAGTALRAGKRAFGDRDELFLTARPDLTQPNPVRVTVNGIAVPAADASGTTWTYDAMSNTVRFAPNRVPSPGQAISVSYQVACLP